MTEERLSGSQVAKAHLYVAGECVAKVGNLKSVPTLAAPHYDTSQSRQHHLPGRSHCAPFVDVHLVTNRPRTQPIGQLLWHIKREGEFGMPRHHRGLGATGDVGFGGLLGCGFDALA